MLTKEKYGELRSLKAKCPYGRDTIVGGRRCINCIFNRLGSDACYGDKESVKKHVRRLGLDY